VLFEDRGSHALKGIKDEQRLFALAASRAIPEPAVVLPDGLSAREAEVLRLIAQGKSNPQIAAELVISVNTVIRHVANIFNKTGVTNRTEAASYAHRHNIAG
jgi:DNA-binding NarL/FixJ family response regulator